MNEWTITENPEIHSHFKGQVVFHKGTKAMQWGQTVSDPDFRPYAKIKDLNVKAKTIRT